MPLESITSKDHKINWDLTRQTSHHLHKGKLFTSIDHQNKVIFKFKNQHYNTYI